MAIAFRCGECKKKLKVKDEHAGRRIKCPECGAKVEVPAASSEDLDEAAPAEPEDEPAPPPRKARGDTAKRARPVAARPAPKEEEAEEPTDEEEQEESPKSKGRSGVVKKKKSGTGSVARRRPAAATSDGGGGFLAGIVMKVVGAVAVIAVILAVNFFTGSAAYDRGFDQVKVGTTTREQVIALMGKPDVAEAEGTEELLGYEAIDKTGRRSSKHTFYFVMLEGGKVVDKERMDEAAFEARFGKH